MEIDQTVCPKCKSVYQQTARPPRLLTMCGHTFCELCIKELIVRKKFNHKYRITCPLDGLHSDLNNPHPQVFPINISVMNLVKSKKHLQENLINNRFSIIKTVQAIEDSNSGHTIELLDPHQPGTHFSKNKGANDTFEQQRSFIEDMSPETCLLHQKQLEIVCIKDCCRICSSCVIFGEHRGHKVKNYKEVCTEIKQHSQQIQKMLAQYHQCFQNLTRDSLKNSIESQIANKQIQAQKQIKKRYKQLREMLAESEKRTLAAMNKQIKAAKLKSKQILSQKITMKSKYQDWERTIKEKIKLMQSNQEQDKFYVIFREESANQRNQQILSEIKNIQANLATEIDRVCESLSVVFDRNKAQQFFNQCCKIESSENSFLGVNESRISYKKYEKEESLLDDIETSELSIMMKSAEYTNKLPPNTKSTLVPEKQHQQMISRLKSSQGHVINRHYKSPKIATLANSRKISLGSSTNLAHSRAKSLINSLPQKYQKNLQQITSGFTDVLDLTGGQLGDDRILQILKTLQSHSLTIVKLVRNKLTDVGYQKIEPFIQNSVMLNLSKNQLTPKTLQKLIMRKNQGKYQNLKSVMLGQNKIQQRKCKIQIDKLKKMGVNICI